VTPTGAPVDRDLRSVAAPGGPVEVLVTGSGEPVTVFLHGAAGSIAQTRPFGSGVGGTRVFAHLAGHGATGVWSPDGAPPAGGVHAYLGRQARAVLRATGATGALGVSLGAGALLGALAAEDGAPPALERLVLCLPPGVPDGPCPDGADGAVRRRFVAMADALDAGDVEALARLLRDGQPDVVRRLPAVALWARRHAADLVAGRASGLATLLRALPGELPAVPARAAGTPPGAGFPATLVLAQEDDAAHPVGAARRWAELLGARLEVLPAGAIGWRGRDDVRRLVAEHLGPGSAVRDATPPTFGEDATTERHRGATLG